MRKFVTTMGMAGALSLSALSMPLAAPVPGFEGLYNSVFTSCTLPDGTTAACESAINAYSGALVTAVDPATALQSFTELRAEVFAANAADTAFQAAIDALFELLLPESGAIAAPGAAGGAGGDAPGSLVSGGDGTPPAASPS